MSSPLAPTAADPTAAGAERFRHAEAYAHYDDNPFLRERDRAVVDMLPAEVRTVADCGCGPGSAARAVAESGRFVASLDASRVALQHHPPNAVQGSVTSLPYGARSFDAAVCLEVLEHLPNGALEAAAAELDRVAGRWLVIGVPLAETLGRNAMRCPRCGAEFHRSGHVQRFDEGRVRRLFPRFATRGRWIGGPPVRPYPGGLLWLRHRVARRFSEMAGRGDVECPSCGETRFPPFRHNLLSFACDGVTRLISRRRPYWIVLLFERERV